MPFLRTTAASPASHTRGGKHASSPRRPHPPRQRAPHAGRRLDHARHEQPHVVLASDAHGYALPLPEPELLPVPSRTALSSRRLSRPRICVVFRLYRVVFVPNVVACLRCHQFNEGSLRVRPCGCCAVPERPGSKTGFVCDGHDGAFLLLLVALTNGSTFGGNSGVHECRGAVTGVPARSRAAGSRRGEDWTAAVAQLAIRCYFAGASLPMNHVLETGVKSLGESKIVSNGVRSPCGNVRWWWNL
ncbi:hypothetical protein GobsT_31440 [Gemmata obscuriglobus]|nr:hypothetical protein GobsT_31440 [Gemmata obscuriglobus]VTS06271.1 unnamed protein product [Gemmata obscuriglobus UQM 2246]